MDPDTLTRRRIVDAAAMFVVCLLSLVLLIYVAFGAASRTYARFHIEATTAQGQLVKSAMESFLRQGLPLAQYVGFRELTDQVMQGDPLIASVEVFNQDNRRVFLNRSEPAAPPGVVQVPHQESGLRRITLDLRNRFERVGRLVVAMRQGQVARKVDHAFLTPLVAAFLASLLFATLTFVGGPRFGERGKPWLAVAFAATFFVISIMVVTTLVSLYTDGVQARGRALTESLGQRFGDIADFHLDFKQISGLDKVLADYRRLNPDISAAAVTEDGRIIVATGNEKIGRRWTSDSSSFQYVSDMSAPGSLHRIKVWLAMPRSVAFRQIFSSVRDFVALFVASAFFAYLFMDLARSLQHSREARAKGDTTGEQQTALSLVKPVFFLAVFVEQLNYPFLAQYVDTMVRAAHLPGGLNAVPFVLFYFTFAATLMAAGRFQAYLRPDLLIRAGLLTAAGALFLLGAFPSFATIIASRALCGVGQGALFIGVQSYILAKAGPERRTRGQSIIVFGFQAGMIAGTAIGSLLVSQLAPAGVFVLGGVVATATALYAALIVPRAAAVERSHESRGLWKDIAAIVRDLHFLKAMGLIGVPAKGILTGIILFALPLLLARAGFSHGDIGQFTMVYAGCVMAASSYVSRLADRTRNTTALLFWGAMMSGGGLLLISLIASPQIAKAFGGVGGAGAVVALGEAIVGVAHGFINAPIVTHVADAEVSNRLGAGSVAATYRFLERIGHMGGPVLMAQLLVIGGGSAHVLAWVGFAVLALGVLFLLPGRAPQRGNMGREAVQ